MSESVNFWLDNKMSAGIKVAEINDQQLVTYRDKFYVVVNGAAQMRGSKAGHYSRSSLPATWKKVLKGEAPQLQTTEPMASVAEDLPISAAETGLARMEVSATPATEIELPALRPAAPATPEPAEAPQKSRPPASARPQKPAGKTELPVLDQEFVEAKCPYCSQKNEIVLDRNKRGKPFFVACVKCNTEFAVRLVQVTMYQAQVAGFR